MTAPADPKYAIIIPHYNDVVRLARCLTSLSAQDISDTEIVVVDNNSTVDLTEIREGFPHVSLYIETQKGAGPARNRGVAETTAPWILFIDSDCLPAPDWLAVAREIAKEDTVIGGRVDVFDETPPPRSGAEAFEAVFAFDMQGYLEKKQFLGSGNLVTSRKVFEAVGGFRPAVSEDVDWSQRAASKGFTLAFENRFAAGHPSRSDWEATHRKWRRLASEGFQLNVDGPVSRLKWAIKGLAMPLSIIAHIPRVLGHSDLSGLEKMRGIGTLARVRLSRMGWMLSQAITGRP
jgi:GT2 family glycosyltransferase